MPGGLVEVVDRGGAIDAGEQERRGVCAQVGQVDRGQLRRGRVPVGSQERGRAGA